MLIGPHYSLSTGFPAPRFHGISNILLKLTLFFFVFVTVFDPEDRLLGLKIPAFLLAYCIGIFISTIHFKNINIPLGLLLYVILMITIPLLSIAYYFFVNGSTPYAGFQLLKAYVFISFALLLYLIKVNLFSIFSLVLTALAFSIIVIFFILINNESVYELLYSFGNKYAIFYLDQRDYGSNLVLSQIYFATSPLLVISIAYYYFYSVVSKNRKWFYRSLVLCHVSAMFLAGTRNNIIVSILLPILLHLYFSKFKLIKAIFLLLVVGLMVLFFKDEIYTFLDPNEFSNAIKISLLSDYFYIFNNLSDLLFGQGLGAYHYWSVKAEDYFITELTYFEVIRNFGLFFGIIMVALLVYPIIYGFFVNKSYPEKHILIGYAFYLLMCFTNPNLFSSMGMLIVSIVVANVFLYKNFIKKEGQYFG